jgi:nucleoid-associated protein YgaU
MGIFDFVRNAGAKVLGNHKPGSEETIKPLSAHLREHGIATDDIRFRFERDGVVVMEGTVPDQDTREKAVLIVGNVDGIERVDDRLRVGKPGNGGVVQGAKPTSPSFGNVQSASASTAKTADFSNVQSSVTSTAPSMSGGSSQSVAQHGAGGDGGAWASKTYTVKAGDNLSKIAKEFYGDANAYQQIFEANKPMLKDPDKIYPGQVLRIPAKH